MRNYMRRRRAEDLVFLTHHREYQRDYKRRLRADPEYRKQEREQRKKWPSVVNRTRGPADWLQRKFQRCGLKLSIADARRMINERDEHQSSTQGTVPECDEQ